jgi:hypothetical protein
MKKYLAFFAFVSFFFSFQPMLAKESKVQDQLIFGNAQSERSHHLEGFHATTIVGGLGESARQLLPEGPHSWQGGSLSFDMAVDGQRLNYLTVKLWGSDCGEALGRLIVYIDGKQLGYNREGDYDVLNQADNDPLALGRFVYVTLPLPPQMTQGKKAVNLQIKLFGPMWPYGETWERFQKPITHASRGIYRAYTHTSPYFVPGKEERQGTMPARKFRSGEGEEVIEQSKQMAINHVGRLLQDIDSYKIADKLKQQNSQLEFLIQAYKTQWMPAYNNPKIVDLAVRICDTIASQYLHGNSDLQGEWTAGGQMGRAIKEMQGQIMPRLEEMVDYAEGLTRRDAWARMLKASVDYWTTHRRSYTNQSMIVDFGIYASNLGLGILKPSLALPESKTLDYLYQSVGLRPWLGSDAGGESTGQSDVPMKNLHAPYGHNYCLFTKKGLSRELGWVATYGETNFTFVHNMIELTGDTAIKNHLRYLVLARLPFRYPSYDADGFACMKLPSEIDNRTAHYPLSGSAYCEPNIGEAWWMQLPALLSDEPTIVGVAQQSIEEGQYFHYVAQRLKRGVGNYVGLMRNVDEYYKVKGLPKSAKRLPMTPGENDEYVFADPEDAVLAVKHGDEVLYFNLYYRSERAVNSVARIFEVTPTLSRLATVKTHTEVIASGQTSTRADWTNSTRSNQAVAPGVEVHQAWAGEVMPISRRPADATQPEYGSWGPFLGKAAFYSLQYGPYTIGMNTTEDHTYELALPNGTYYDLVSKSNCTVTNGKLKVGPLGTVVLVEKRK